MQVSITNALLLDVLEYQSDMENRTVASIVEDAIEAHIASSGWLKKMEDAIEEKKRIEIEVSGDFFEELKDTAEGAGFTVKEYICARLGQILYGQELSDGEMFRKYSEIWIHGRNDERIN